MHLTREYMHNTSSLLLSEPLAMSALKPDSPAVKVWDWTKKRSISGPLDALIW